MMGIAVRDNPSARPVSLVTHADIDPIPAFPCDQGKEQNGEKLNATNKKIRNEINQTRF
jgi:hypothetical protein